MSRLPSPDSYVLLPDGPDLRTTCGYGGDLTGQHWLGQAGWISLA
jgi:hypothetical protein